MSTDEQIRAAEVLLNADQSDDDTERLTGLSLREILGLRATRASAPSSSRRNHAEPISYRMIKDAKFAAGQRAPATLRKAAREWLASCPTDRNRYESGRAWLMAQTLASTFRALAN